MVKATIELLFAPIILAMQQARRLLLYVLTLTVVLMLGSLRGWPQAPPPSELTVTLGIEVRLPDRDIRSRKVEQYGRPRQRRIR